jgi:hypothetical protein
VTSHASHPEAAELDEVAEALAHELALLVDAAETVLTELEAVEDLRSGEDGLAAERRRAARSARSARRDAVVVRTRAIEATEQAVAVCERSREVVDVCSTRLVLVRRRHRR